MPRNSFANAFIQGIFWDITEQVSSFVNICLTMPYITFSEITIISFLWYGLPYIISSNEIVLKHMVKLIKRVSMAYGYVVYLI